MLKNLPLKIKQEYLYNTKVTIFGDNFNYIRGNGLYLSGSTFFTEFVDLYSQERLLSSNNVPFSGIPINEFSILNNNTIEFNLPTNLIPGEYDVIFCNPAGQIKASNNKKFNYIIVI